MTTDFGITPEGFNAKTLRDILSEIETDQRADIDPNLDVSPQSPDGQRNAVTARQVALLWELVKVLNDSLDPDRAEDDQLISLCKITGTRPRGATKSQVTCTCTLDSGTTLAAGVSFAAVDGTDPPVLFTPKEDFTAPSTGNHSVVFVAELAGPVIANAGTLTVRATNDPGWTAVTNPLDATPGKAADTNETLRARREAELAAAGSATPRSLRADLMRLEDDTGNLVVSYCAVLNNPGDTTDADGVPGHSIEAIVYDSPTLPNDAIAQRIFDNLGGGTNTHGDESGTALDEETGTEVVIKFSRPTLRNVYVTYETLATTSTYGGDAAFKAAVVEFLRSNIGVGDDVTELLCWFAAKQPGVRSVGAVKFGFTASPTAAADLEISPRELAQFDTTRVVIA